MIEAKKTSVRYSVGDIILNVEQENGMVCASILNMRDEPIFEVAGTPAEIETEIKKFQECVDTIAYMCSGLYDNIVRECAPERKEETND